MSSHLIPTPVSRISIPTSERIILILPFSGVNFSAFERIFPRAVISKSGYTIFDTLDSSITSIRLSVRSNLDRMSSPISMLSHFHDSFLEKNKSASTTVESSDIIFFALLIP
jgi:hypothetical protein